MSQQGSLTDSVYTLPTKFDEWAGGSLKNSYASLDSSGGGFFHDAGGGDVCGICRVKFRKRDMTWRHYCRVCGLCVCSDCLPNKVVIDGFRGPQRVCIHCVRIASSPARDHQLVEKAAQLALRLRELQDPAGEVTYSGQETPTNIEEALTMAEAALNRLEFTKSGAEAAIVEAEAVAAREAQKRAELEVRVLEAEAAAKLAADNGNSWRRTTVVASQVESFAGPSGGEEPGGHDKCTSDKCTGAGCAMM